MPPTAMSLASKAAELAAIPFLGIGGIWGKPR